MYNLSIKNVFFLFLVVMISFSVSAKDKSGESNTVSNSALSTFEGPGDRPGKKKKNKYRKSTSGAKNFNKRLKSSRGRAASMSIAGNGSNNRLSGSRFRMKGTGTKVKSKRKANNSINRKNKYKFNWIRKSRKERSTNYRHDRTGDRSNSFRYKK